jgi:hypothetical protein
MKEQHVTLHVTATFWFKYPTYVIARARLYEDILSRKKLHINERNRDKILLLKTLFPKIDAR